MRWLILLVAIAACHPGGEYVARDRETENIDRGETNGRSLDFISNKPGGDEWDIRVRGTSMWASYGKDAATDKLGAFNLTDKESRKVWRLVDAMDLANHKKGKPDDDNGYVTLRLREPGGEDDKHDVYTVYIPRENGSEEEDDENAGVDKDFIELAIYLRELVQKYKKETPNF